MYTDPEKLEQIILNLLLNAQKFTMKGYIKLKIMKYVPMLQEVAVDSENMTISPKSLGSTPYKIRFLIMDTGIGIEKEKVATLFNLF